MVNLDGFAENIEEYRKAWKVPGVAVAVVKDGETIFSQGFGQRSVEDNLPVTEETIFAIGSSSKAFASASVAIAIDDGKLDWDKPVQDYLPDFKMYDLFATTHMSARDLLCHRSGLPRHDLAWYGSDDKREDFLKRLRYFEPSRDFRTYFQYQNFMYMTAGYLAGYVEGTSWEALVRERIFKPLGMNHSQFSVNDTVKGSNYALPYGEKKDQIEKLPFRNIDEMGPAGSINSNLIDMVQWVNFQLGNGKVGDQQIITETNLRQMQSAQMTIADPIWFELMGTKLISYGLGWFIQPFGNEILIHHGGNIDGFSAFVSLMPGQNAGVIVLTNLNGNALTEAVAFEFYDRLLGTSQAKDWNKYFLDFYGKMKSQAEEAKAQSASDRVQGTQPSHAIDAYVGEYENPGYGVLKIAKQDGDAGKLVALYNSNRWLMEHYHYDIFEGEIVRQEIRIPFTFETDSKGNIGSLKVPFEGNVKPIVFARIADKSLKNRAFLEQFVGKYEVMGMTLTVSLRGDDLIASVPGQGDQVLEPYMDTTFNLKGLSGFSIKFVKDDSGAITEAVITQPGATLSAKRIAETA